MPKTVKCFARKTIGEKALINQKHEIPFEIRPPTDSVSGLSDNYPQPLKGGAMQFQSSEELIARLIIQAFPAADLEIKGDGLQVVYDISLGGKSLVRLDHIGAVFNFPTNRSGKMTWSGIKEGGPENVAEVIVRYLADAGFTVFSKTGKRVPKRPVFIGRHTFCPKCNERGFIRRIAYGKVSQELDSERFVFGGCGIGFNDPEIKCIGCGWEGISEDVRFARKKEVE